MNPGRGRRLLTYAALFLFLAGSVAGCGKKAGNVSGKVTLDGKPVAGGSITFACLDGEDKIQTGRTAGIENDGSYRVTNIPEGPVKITVQGKPHGVPSWATQKMRRRPGSIVPQMRESSGDEVIVPTRYTSDQTTDLKYTVTRGEQQHDVVLTK